MSWLRDIFYDLLGIPNEAQSAIHGLPQIGFRSWNWLGIVLIGATLLGVLTVLSYRRAGRHVSVLPRYALAAVRVLFLLFLLSLLLRPVLRYTLEGSVRRAMLVLIDSSQSMVTPEKRLDEEDLKRAAIARDLLDPAKGLQQPLERAAGQNLEGVTRIDLVKASLNNPRLNLLNRLNKEYDVRVFSMDRGTPEVGAARDGEKKRSDTVSTAFMTKLNAEAPVTPMGDGVKELLGRSRGQPLAGIFVLTDGQSNSGTPPAAAAEQARLSDVPLYFYGVGISSPKDIAVASIFSQDICFVDDEVPVVVRVRSTNLGGRNSKATLKLADQVVDTRDVTLTDAGEQVVTMMFTPKKPGDYELSASLEPVSEEANRTNNAESKKIRVIDGKIKVLLVEQYPRWEFKYLQALLSRDRRVQLKTYLAEADPQLAELKDSQYLKTFPPTKAELIPNYDLVILGDLDPKGLGAQQMEAISEFVNKFGGGLIVVAGRRGSPGTWKGTPIEKLLPVELESVAGGGGGGPRKPIRDTSDADRPIKLEVTPMGYESPMLRLSDKADESKRIWAKLPPIFWDATVTRAKPGASVLMVDPDPNKATRAGKMPVVAMQQYGLGQVLYVGTDNTWRWRKNAADKYHATLWGQMVQRLALPHLMGEAKLVQLTSDKKKYATGDKVTIYARIYKPPTYDPVTDETVTGGYESADGRSRASVTLRRLPEQPGLYRGEFTAPDAGVFQFHVDRDTREKLEINVEQPRLEYGETALNEPLLREMAKVTGGAYFREEDLHKMPDSMRLKTERVKSKLEVDVWSSPAYFIILLLLVTAEWIGRKIVQLR